MRAIGYGLLFSAVLWVAIVGLGYLIWQVTS